jgi:hypothetical protein
VCCEVRARERKISEQRPEKERESSSFFFVPVFSCGRVEDETRTKKKKSRRQERQNFFRRRSSFRAGKHEREDVIGTHSPQIEKKAFTSLVFSCLRSRTRLRERARASERALGNLLLFLRSDILFCQLHFFAIRKKNL